MSSRNSEKVLSLISQINSGETDNRRIMHDLQGPLINITGFTLEIQKSLLELRELVQANKSSIPPNLFEKMENMICEDLTPCVKYLDSSANKLSEKIVDLFTDKD